MNMRPILLAALALCLACPARAEVPPAPAGVPLAEADRSAINDLFKRWERAWAAQDSAAWAKLFHEDGTWVLWTGGVWQGRPAMEAGLREPFATFYRGSRQTWGPLDIRPLAPGVVVTRGISTTVGDSRQPGATIYGNKMFVITKRNGDWRILYGQNTRLNEAEIAKLKPRG